MKAATIFPSPFTSGRGYVVLVYRVETSGIR
jgi:hypothetical protein